MRHFSPRVPRSLASVAVTLLVLVSLAAVSAVLAAGHNTSSAGFLGEVASGVGEQLRTLRISTPICT